MKIYDKASFNEAANRFFRYFDQLFGVDISFQTSRQVYSKILGFNSQAHLLSKIPVSIHSLDVVNPRLLQPYMRSNVDGDVIDSEVRHYLDSDGEEFEGKSFLVRSESYFDKWKPRKHKRNNAIYAFSDVIAAQGTFIGLKNRLEGLLKAGNSPNWMVEGALSSAGVLTRAEAELIVALFNEYGGNPYFNYPSLHEDESSRARLSIARSLIRILNEENYKAFRWVIYLSPELAEWTLLSHTLIHINKMTYGELKIIIDVLNDDFLTGDDFNFSASFALSSQMNLGEGDWKTDLKGSMDILRKVKRFDKSYLLTEGFTNFLTRHLGIEKTSQLSHKVDFLMELAR